MKNNSTEIDKSIDALLAKMPVETSSDFADRVLTAIREEDAQIDALLKSQPVEAPADFCGRVLAECAPAKKRSNLVRFAAGILGAAAAVAVLTVPVMLQKNHAQSEWLADQVAEVLAGDPELSALAVDESADELSLSEFITASEILTAVNPTTIEILAYNE